MSRPCGSSSSCPCFPWKEGKSKEGEGKEKREKKKRKEKETKSKRQGGALLHLRKEGNGRREKEKGKKRKGEKRTGAEFSSPFYSTSYSTFKGANGEREKRKEGRDDVFVLCLLHPGK